MDLVVCKDTLAVAQFADRWVERMAKAEGARSFYLPAGLTPEPLYKLWSEKRPAYLNQLRFLQIDDVLTGNNAWQFKGFFETHMAPWLSQFEWIGQGATQADAAVLGLGTNGHVAFHEPGLPRHFFSGCVRLSEATEKRLALSPGTWGVTYGLGAFLRAKAILLIVTGAAKREIFAQFTQRRGDFPALALRDHPALTVVIDQAVAD